MSRLVEHAKRELEASGYKLYGKDSELNNMIIESVMELIQTFSDQGHSGASAPYCLDLFTKLALFKPLSPLTGEDSEWNNISGEMSDLMDLKLVLYQNNRCSKVFKDGDGKAYNIEGKVFISPDGAYFTSRDSRVYITFPYTPETQYVKVDKDGNPLV